MLSETSAWVELDDKPCGPIEGTLHESTVEGPASRLQLLSSFTSGLQRFVTRARAYVAGLRRFVPGFQKPCIPIFMCLLLIGGGTLDCKSTDGQTAKQK